ncbi:MAG: hypothetical protein ACK59M_11520 [Pseudomonadota bacterium]
MSPLERTLIAGGLLLFLIGLLQGTVVQVFASPRLALSAHIAAVQNGIVLVVFGLALPRLRLALRPGRIAVAAMVVGMFAIWMSFSIAAIAGSASAFAFAGQGPIASPAVDMLVTAVVYFGSAASVLGTLLFLIGALKRGG